MKTVVKYHHWPIRMAKIKNTENIKYCERGSNEKFRGLLASIWSSVGPLIGNLATSYKKKHVFTIDSSVPLLGIRVDVKVASQISYGEEDD